MYTPQQLQPATTFLVQKQEEDLLLYQQYCKKFLSFISSTSDSFRSELSISAPDLLINSAMTPHAAAPEKAEKKFTPQAGFGCP